MGSAVQGVVILNIEGHGSLRGHNFGTSTRRFLGIPYALPPTGSRRWQKPSPLPNDHIYGSRSEPLDCTRHRAICPQPPYVMDGRNLSAVPGAEYSEDCLMLNIWAPASGPPAGKLWPVYVWIHGGWLQMGNPCHTDRFDPYQLIDKEGCGLDAVIVAIGYRLNIFGFLAGEGLCGNFGLWDQRCALQWVQKHIHNFGGDKTLVTVGGLSAGAYSAHIQLQYELLHTSGSEPLFQNVFLCSNAISIQPKTLQEVDKQLNEVYAALQIPLELSTQEKLDMLREVPADELIRTLASLRLHTFRAVTDNELIHDDLIQRCNDGTIAKEFVRRGMRIVVGEAESEEVMYQRINPPSSASALQTALENYYPLRTCEKILSAYSSRGLDHSTLYGIVTSEMQVRMPLRKLCKTLLDAGLSRSSLFRYRSSFRAKCMDQLYDPSVGVTHGVDMCVWNFLQRYGHTEEETAAVKRWLNASLIPLIKGEELGSGGAGLRIFQHFDPDGTIKTVDDVYWDDLMALKVRIT